MECESDLEEEKQYSYRIKTRQRAKTRNQCKTKKESTPEEIPDTQRKPPEEVIEEARGTSHQYGFVEEHNNPSLETKLIKLKQAQSSKIANREEEMVKGAQGVAKLCEIDDELFDEAPGQRKQKLKNARGTAKSYQIVDEKHEDSLKRIEKVTNARVASKSRKFKEKAVEGDAIRKHKKLISARGTARKHELEGEVTEEAPPFCIDNAETAFVIAKEIEKDKSETSTALIKLQNDSRRTVNRKKHVVVNMESTEPSPKVKKEMTNAPSNAKFADGFENRQSAAVLYSTDVSKVDFRSSGATNIYATAAPPSGSYNVGDEVLSQGRDRQSAVIGATNQPESCQTKWTYSGSRCSEDHNFSTRRRPIGSTSFVLFTICIGLVLLIWFVYGK